MSLLVANWKMNHGAAEAHSFAAAISAAKIESSRLWIAPPATLIGQLRKELPIGARVGSQNIHWESNGAFTGELAKRQITDAGGSFAIVGHSERRHKFAESNESAAIRAINNLSSDFAIIFCIGETLQQREANRTSEILVSQLTPLFVKMKELPNNRGELLIAYEPVWAIGTGKAATPETIATAHKEIDQLWRTSGVEAPTPPILYGGSVTPDNWLEIVNVPFCAGALVGSAALKSENVIKMLQS
jgi:triosephosphate isomerase